MWRKQKLFFARTAWTSCSLSWKPTAVMETYGPEGEEPKPRDLCLVDFQTLELYSLQEQYVSYYIRDYYVRLDQTDDGMKVEAVYAPVRD